MDRLIAKSALHTAYRTGKFGLTSAQPLKLSERRGLTMMNLVVFDHQAVSQTLNDSIGLGLPEIGRSAVGETHRILWIGPDRYLIVAQDPDLYNVLKSVIKDEQGGLQDLSSARTVIRIEGLACRSAMAKGLPVDLDDAETSHGRVVLSSFDHHYPAVIHNISEQEPGFDIYVTRSFALSFWQWLCDSCLEFGYEIS